VISLARLTFPAPSVILFHDDHDRRFHSALPPSRDHESFLAGGMAIIWAITLAKVILHIYFNNHYGYFRDEFDYISCGDHLGWGYVDQPPLIPFLIYICRGPKFGAMAQLWPQIKRWR
jgi:hypothetical protein